MKNLLLSFICLMLCAPLGVKAQVNVSNSTQLENAFTEYGKIAGYQTAYNEASAEVIRIQNQMANVQQYTTTTITETVYDDACSEAYMNYDAVAKATIAQWSSLYLYVETKSDVDLTDEGWDEYFIWLDGEGLEFDVETMQQFLSIDEYKQYGVVTKSYNVYPVEPSKFGLAVSAEKTKVTNVYSKIRKAVFNLCYRAKVGSSWTVSELPYEGVSSLAVLKNYISAVLKLQGEELNKSAQTVTTTTSVENPVYTALQKDLNEAKSVQTSADEALTAAKKYNKIVVVGSFETSAYVESFGGTISGNGYTITEQNGNALIGELTGSVDKLCVKNAKIANENNGSYTKCAVIFGGITGYVENTGVSYSSLPELAAAMPDAFGVDMTNANATLLPVDQNNKVYKVSYWALTSKDVQQTKYLNVKNGGLVGTTKPTLSPNEFLVIESANTNSAITEKNVIEKISENYVCNECYITDAKEFYAPVTFVASNLTYTRSFSTDVWSSLVLPFSLNTTVLNNKGVSRVNEFGSFDGGNVTFIAASEIEAYKPYIIKTTTSGAIFSNISNVKVAKSGSTNLTKLGSNGYFYGNLGTRRTVPTLSNNGMYRVYGFNKNNQMARGSESAYFDAFRCYLIAKESEFTSSSANSKVRVQFLDKYGDVIDSDATTDVDIVKSNNISVVGGNNEIIVNSDKEQSVSVYTTNGKLVQVADIAEGENVISVNPGMYIVNGKKVIVK
ncbi:MAG: T9SS type A sorting domain-containing protein [Bacteroidaceae bacterium]|nr:T9SS type A sorting domain-containing protein [Bacteroidaceae bacterium]